MRSGSWAFISDGGSGATRPSHPTHLEALVIVETRRAAAAIELLILLASKVKKRLGECDGGVTIQSYLLIIF